MRVTYTSRKTRITGSESRLTSHRLKKAAPMMRRSIQL